MRIDVTDPNERFENEEGEMLSLNDVANNPPSTNPITP